MFSFFKRKPAEEAAAPPPAPPPSPVSPAAPEEEIEVPLTFAELLEQCQAAPQNVDAALAVAQRAKADGQGYAAVSALLRASNALADVDPQGAIQVLKAFDATGACPIEGYFLLTTLYKEQGQLQDAERAARRVLREDINNREALILVAELTMANGNFRDTILTCNKLIAVDGRDPVARELIADAYARQGDTDEAVKAWLLAAMHYARMQEKSEAIRMYERVLEVDPNHPTAVREKGNLSG